MKKCQHNDKVIQDFNFPSTSFKIEICRVCMQVTVSSVFKEVMSLSEFANKWKELKIV